MAEKVEAQDRNIAILITIRIDSIPMSKVADIQKQAFDVGDEWGAVVNVSTSSPFIVNPQG